MDKSEKETIITINEADLERGWFSFGTSIERHKARLLKIVGGEKNLTCPMKISTFNGKPVYWSCQVPLRYLSKGTFGVRKPQSNRGKPRSSVQGHTQTMDEAA